MRALVIEDDPRLARMLERGLREEGIAVELCGDGQAGLAQLRQGVFDVCVLDLLLPGIDGLVVLELARQDHVATPILVLTARDGVSDRVRGLDVGADDYLVKPFAFAELLARLRALVRRGRDVRPGKLCIGSIEIDPAAHQVTCRGERIEFSAKQFALLELFFRHPGEVLARSMILQRIWGYTFDPGTNLVDVHVRQLRLRIDSPNRTSLIQTVRGVGYRLRSDETA